MASGYKFPFLDTSGNPTTTYVDMEDMFVRADQFRESGLYAWGYGALGQLGDGTIANRSSPIQVGSLNNWKILSNNTAGLDNSAAIKNDGSLWTWGYNHAGQLGLNDVAHRSSPVQVGALNNWKQISRAGFGMTALKNDGTLWAWGYNLNGQLGQNDVVNRSSPVQIGALNNWKQISNGYYHTLAIKTDGSLWSWGRGSSGQLGDGTTIDKSSPIQVGALTNWKQLAAAGFGGSVIKTDGTLWTWGRNSNGSLGLNDVTHRSSPVQVGSLTNWKLVSSSIYATAAIKTDGTLWTWGSNAAGELGDGTTIPKSSPIQVGALTNWKLISIGGDTATTTAAIKTDGTLWTWGNTPWGQMGDGTTINKSSPVQIGSLTNWKQVTIGQKHTLAILSSDY